MDDDVRRRLLEFSAMPLVEHAVEALRVAVPPGWHLLVERAADGSTLASLMPDFRSREKDHKKVKLTKPQLAAFDFLMAATEYEYSLMEQAWPNAVQRSPKRTYAADLPQHRREALGIILNDAELNLRVEFYSLARRPGHDPAMAINVHP